VIISKFPDFPIFCVSKDSRFIVYLNRSFQYQQKYKVGDVASIQILRPDLFLVYILSVRDKYIRMISDVTYKEDKPKSIDWIRVILVFQAEKDKNLLISGDNTFSEDCYLPKADFMTDFHPSIEDEDVPYWFYSNDIPHQ
jgi:hypothetical protein